jgi:hypothetical protein
MAIVKTQRKCKPCGMRVMAERSGTNHILHLLITVLMCGCWLPIWLLASFKIGGWRCCRCGGKV